MAANRHLIDEHDWAEVVKYLNPLNVNQIKQLGGLLGLSAANVDHMIVLPADMVKAWIRKEEEVTKKCGPQLTWEILAQKLRKMIPAQTHIAAKILKEQCTQISTVNAQLFDEAMKDGSVTLQILKMLITGVAGSGKTSTLDLLLDEDPKPTSNRQSTPCACRPVCVIPIVSEKTWDKLKLKEFIALIAKKFSDKRSSKAVSDEASETETETDSVDDTSEEASATIEELVQLMDLRSGPSTPLNQNWISVTDCGGQPQFQVILPVFLRQTSLFVHVQKLSESLSAKPVIKYYDKGKSLSKPIQSPLSNEEHLKCAVQSVQSFRYVAESQEKTSSEVHDPSKGNPSTMLFIATHKDEYEKKKNANPCSTDEEMKKSGESCDKKEQSKCFETCEEKEKRMTELLWPYTREGNLNVIYCGESMKNLLFGVNATSRGAEEKKLAKEIRTEINKRFPPGKQIPLRWFVLQLKLQEFGETNKRQIITKKECLDVARSIHLKSKEALDAALRYLDDLNIIFYYPEILPDVIFCHVQVLLDIVTKIVEHQYRLMGDTNDHTPTDGKWLNFRNFGRITEAILKEILGDACFQPNVFTVNDLLTLFRALHIIADYNLEGPEYFMACLLRIMEPDKVKDHIASFQSNMHLRVLHFPNGLFTGVFCFTIAILLHKTPASTTASVESATASATASDSTPTEWKLNFVPRSNTPKCLYRNIVQFIVPGNPGTVTLVDRFSFIEIIVAESPCYEELCPLVKKTVLDSLAKATKHLHYVDNQPEEGVLCQCGEGEQHPAIIKYTKKGKLWLECTYTQSSTTVPGDLKEINDIWNDEEIGSEPMELSDCVEEDEKLNSYQADDSMSSGMDQNLFVEQNEMMTDCISSYTLNPPTNLAGIHFDYVGMLTYSVDNITSQTLQWIEHGLNLCIEPYTLKGSEYTCTFTLGVTGNVSDRFQLPPNFVLVSPIFFVTPSVKLHKPITLEIEHCCNLRSEADANCLVVIVAHTPTSSRPPYNFEVLEGGNFPVQSSWGRVSVSSFSLFAIVYNYATHAISTLIYPPVVYQAYVYCCKNGQKLYQVGIATSRKHTHCKSVIESNYSSGTWSSLTNFEFEFDGTNDNTLSLILPEDELINNEWKISAYCSPCDIKRSVLDNYDHSKCELSLRWLHEDTAPVELISRRIGMRGVNKNYFQIIIDPTASDDQPSTDEQPMYAVNNEEFGDIMSSHIPRANKQVKADLLKDSVQLILLTCNENEKWAVYEKLDPPTVDPSTHLERALYLPRDNTVIGTFAEYTVAVLTTDQGKKPEIVLKKALDTFPKAEAIIGVGVGYGRNPSTLKFADVMVSDHIEDASQVSIVEEDIGNGQVIQKIGQCGPRVAVKNELLRYFKGKTMQWKVVRKFKVTKKGRIAQAKVDTIVSSETLMRSKHLKEQYMKLTDRSIGGEMEGCVLLNMIEWMEREEKHRSLSVIVIKGVADYGDNQKDKRWQFTAAKAAVDFVHYCLEETRGEAKFNTAN